MTWATGSHLHFLSEVRWRVTVRLLDSRSGCFPAGAFRVQLRRYIDPLKVTPGKGYVFEEKAVTRARGSASRVYRAHLPYSGCIQAFTPGAVSCSVSYSFLIIGLGKRKWLSACHKVCVPSQRPGQ